MTWLKHRDTKLDVRAVVSNHDEMGPFQYVLMQEATRMNCLLAAILASLNELEHGLKGDLSMSDDMESLQKAMSDDLVPTQWARVAYPSMRGLGSWLVDLQARINQLQDWLSSPRCAARTAPNGNFRSDQLTLAYLGSTW